MYLSYYPIGTAGHRALLLLSYLPYQNQNYYGKYPPAFAAPAAPYQPAAAEPSGGINAVLEYEPQNMAAFLGWCLFGMLSQNRSPTTEFENVLVSILHATRLPKLTIVIALEYLNQRYSSTQPGPLAELEVFMRVVISLILANKFNDDNTFTNRLWCGATGLNIEAINREEAAWLKEVNWQLNVVNFQSNIRTLEECWATWLEKYSASLKPVASVYLSPAMSSDGFYYSSIPSSPVYDLASSVHSPVSSSPIKISQDGQWAAPAVPYGRYVLPQQSIWAYTPQQYPYMAPEMPNYYGYANPYYGMASC